MKFSEMSIGDRFHFTDQTGLWIKISSTQAKSGAADGKVVTISTYDSLRKYTD